MKSLTRFFQENHTMDYMIPIIDGTSNISLRIIDWFVTNYSKKHNTRIISKKTEAAHNAKQFLVFLNYKSQLKAYTKKQFDPFCRRGRISFYYDKQDRSKFIITTVGQLNFFRWAITNGILDYIDENIEQIETDMNTCIRTAYKKSGFHHTNKSGATKPRRKRQELSKSASKTLNHHQVNITIHFE